MNTMHSACRHVQEISLDLSARQAATTQAGIQLKRLTWAALVTVSGIGYAWAQGSEPTAPSQAQATEMAATEQPAGAREADIDRIVAQAMETFSVPGVAVGIVTDGRLAFSKGYGVRELGKPAPVDADTIFAIGSNSKAFTAAALAILVDEGKLQWTDRVIDHLPQFRLADPYVTREFTIIDLLTHRSGLGLGAGDLMFWPTSDMTRTEMIDNLRHLPVVSSFRSEFAYDNLLYIVAGEIIPAITGQSWEEFVETRIFARLGMQPCAATSQRLQGTSNIAATHVFIDGKLQKVSSPLPLSAAAAGGIDCNVANMAKWVQVQLAGGKMADGGMLFSAEQHEAMWTPQTILSFPPWITELTGTHFRNYGLGWFMEDFRGFRRVSHSGGVLGMVTHVSMLPELGLGVIVLTNQQSAEALNAINLHILDAYARDAQHRRVARLAEQAPTDWVALLKERADQQEVRNRELEALASAQVSKSAGAPPLPLAEYVGLYRDPWRGDATIRQEGKRLILKFSRTDQLEGVLEHNGRGIFVVRWNDRTLTADAYVRFTMGYDGKVEGMTMKAISPRTDFSFDFHDLSFRKIEGPAENATASR